MTITIFHAADGAITDVIESDQLTPEDVTNLTPPGGGYILSDDYPDGETQYVSAGALADRPEINVEPDWIITGDGTDSVWFEAPDETEVLVTREGSDALVAEGVTEAAGLVTFASVVSGRFVLRATPPWPWQATEIAVDVGGPESDDASETPPGSPATVLSFDLAMPVLQDLEVLDKPKFNRADWDVSKWPFHAYYELTRYGTESDALADANGVLIGPITDSFYKDADDVTNGLVWYRVNDVDDLDNRSPKGAPVSVTARGANSSDLNDDAADPRVVKQVDRSNMVRDPDCVEKSLFTGNGGTLQSYPLGVGSVTESSNYLYLPAASGELAINTKANKANGFAVKANKKYYASLTLGQRDTGPATYTAYVLWYSMAADGTLTLLGNSLLGTHTGSSQVSHEKVVIAPASARRAVLIGYKNSGATGDLTYYSPIFRKAVTDEQVDKTLPGTPTGLTLTQVARNTDAGDGKVETAVRATWTAPASGVEVKRYILEISDGTDTWDRPAKKSGVKFQVVIGKTYTVKVSAESIFGEEGGQTAGVSITPVAKVAAPGSPTSVTIVPKAKLMRIKGTAPADKDLAGHNYYFNTVNNAGTATLLDFSDATKYDDTTERAAGTNCYYWMAAVNRSGVEGTRVAASNNPQVARGVAVADLNVTDLNSYAENTDFALGPNVGWTGGINFIQSDPANALGPSGYVFTRAYSGAASSQGIRNAAKFPVRAGQQWTIGAVAKTDASFAGAGIGARLSYRNASMVEVTSTALTHANVTAGATPYTERQLTVTVPNTAGIVWAILETFVYNQTAGQFWITHAYARPTVLAGMTDPTAPPAPTGLTLGQNYQLVDQGDGTVKTKYKATWNPLAGAVRFELQISQADTAGGTYTVISNIITTATLAEFDVTIGKFYKAALRAFSFNGTAGAQSGLIGPVQPLAAGTTLTTPAAPTVAQIANGYQYSWPVPTDKTYRETAVLVNGVELRRTSAGYLIDTTPREIGATPSITIRHYDRSGNATSASPATVAPAWRATKAAEIGTMEVKPSKLFRPGGTNRIRDYELEEPEATMHIYYALFTDLETFMPIPQGDGGAVPGWVKELNPPADLMGSSFNRIRFNGTGYPINARLYSETDRLSPVEEGLDYVFESSVKRAAHVDRFNLHIRFFTVVAGVVTFLQQYTNTTTAKVESPANGTAYRLFGAMKAPSGAVYASVRVEAIPATGQVAQFVAASPKIREMSVVGDNTFATLLNDTGSVTNGNSDFTVITGPATTMEQVPRVPRYAKIGFRARNNSGAVADMNFKLERFIPVSGLWQQIDATGTVRMSVNGGYSEVFLDNGAVQSFASFVGAMYRIRCTPSQGSNDLNSRRLWVEWVYG